MSIQSNSIQVCLIDGCEPVVRLKGETPNGMYQLLNEKVKEQLDAPLSELCIQQYEEIGHVEIDTTTGEVKTLNLTIDK